MLPRIRLLLAVAVTICLVDATSAEATQESPEDQVLDAGPKGLDHFVAEWAYSRLFHLRWTPLNYTTPGYYIVEAAGPSNGASLYPESRIDGSENETEVFISELRTEEHIIFRITPMTSIANSSDVPGETRTYNLTVSKPGTPTLRFIRSDANSATISVDNLTPPGKRVLFFRVGERVFDRTNFTIDELKPNSEVNLKVYACHGVNDGDPCGEPGELNVTTNVDRPGPVTNLNVHRERGKPKLTWGAPKDGPPAGYQVEIRELEAERYKVMTILCRQDETAFIYDYARAGKRYSVTVSAYNLDRFDGTTRVVGDGSFVETTGETKVNVLAFAFGIAMLVIFVLGVVGATAYYCIRRHRPNVGNRIL